VGEILVDIFRDVNKEVIKPVGGKIIGKDCQRIYSLLSKGIDGYVEQY